MPRLPLNQRAYSVGCGAASTGGFSDRREAGFAVPHETTPELRAAGAPEEKARAASESIPVSEHLAPKQDISALEVKMWRMAVTVASLAVLLNKFLDWMMR